VPDLQITMANHISASAAQSALSIQELVTTMKTAGMADTAIRQTLLNDLNTGGPLFGSFRNKLKNTVKNGVEASSNGSANGKFTKAGIEQFQWVSVGDGKVCPDCEERHGETGTMEYFKTIGLPASGFSICTTNCRCQLVPESYKGENLDKPLIREKKKPLSVTDPKMAGKHKTVADSISWIKTNVGATSVSLSGLDISTANRITKSFKSRIDDGYKFTYKKVDTYRSNSGVIARSGTERLRFNLKYTGDIKNYEGFTASRAELSGHFPSGCKTFESILTHELGHGLAIDDVYGVGNRVRYGSDTGRALGKLQSEYFRELTSLNKSFQKKWVASGKSLQELREYKDSFNSGRSVIKDGKSYWVSTNRTKDYYKEVYGNVFISDYAKKAIHEWVAEGFTMAINSPDPSPYALKIRDLILGKYK